MGLSHLVQGDPVAGVVDYHLVPAIAIDHLLQAEGDVRLCAVITQHGIEVRHDPNRPFIPLRVGFDLWWGAFLVATAERAGIDDRAGIAFDTFLGVFRAHATGGGDQHRLGRDYGVDPDFAYVFAGFAHADSNLRC